LGLKLGADLSIPYGKGRAFDRLSRIFGKVEDASKTHMSPGQAEDD